MPRVKECVALLPTTIINEKECIALLLKFATVIKIGFYSVLINVLGLLYELKTHQVKSQKPVKRGLDPNIKFTYECVRSSPNTTIL